MSAALNCRRVVSAAMRSASRTHPSSLTRTQSRSRAMTSTAAPLNTWLTAPPPAGAERTTVVFVATCGVPSCETAGRAASMTIRAASVRICWMGFSLRGRLTVPNVHSYTERANMSGDTSRPVALIVLDGWGYREESAGNAIRLARTPAWDAIWAHPAKTLLAASGLRVGLPDGQMGNSEVGHLNLGAGRVVMQDLVRISAAIADGSFFRN